MSSAHETKRAMFRAAIAAQVAGESTVRAERIVAALLRTDSVQEFCARHGMDGERAADELDESAPPAQLELQPLDIAVQGVLDTMIADYGEIAGSPLEVLLAIIRADADLAARLGRHGLSAEAIASALDESSDA